MPWSDTKISMEMREILVIAGGRVYYKPARIGASLLLISAAKHSCIPVCIVEAAVIQYNEDFDPKSRDGW